MSTLELNREGLRALFGPTVFKGGLTDALPYSNYTATIGIVILVFSVVVTPENRVVGIAQYAGFGRAYLFPLAFIRDTVARRVLEKQGFVPAGWLGARGDSIAQLTDDEFNMIGLSSRAGVVLRQVVLDSAAAASGDTSSTPLQPVESSARGSNAPEAACAPADGCVRNPSGSGSGRCSGED